MPITGKKFSELTDEQKEATRQPITGWLVNNALINPNGNKIVFKNTNENHDNGVDTSGTIMLMNPTSEGYSPTISFIAEDNLAIGFIIYIVNWGVSLTNISIAESPFGDGVVVLPTADYWELNNVFGVFKAEKTDVNQWTLSVIENGELVLGEE